MSPARAYKRKLLNFSVNRAMQFRMIGKISLILFASQLLSGLIFFYFSNQEITASFQMFHIKARNFLDFLLPVVLAAVVISLAIGFLASLFFPKPIAGGLYRIEEDLKKVLASSDLTVQVKLREGDQTQGVAAQVNTLLTDYRQRVAASQRALAVLEQLTQQETAISIEELKTLHDQLHKQFGSLKI